MTIIGISGRCCCVRAITGHAAALPSPAMNSRRRIGHASKPLCGAAYLGQDRMGTGCISPGGQLPANFFAVHEAALGPTRKRSAALQQTDVRLRARAHNRPVTALPAGRVKPHAVGSSARSGL